MSAFGRFECKVSDDARYVKGEFYDIVLNGDMSYNHYADADVPVILTDTVPVAVVTEPEVPPVVEAGSEDTTEAQPPLGG